MPNITKDFIEEHLKIHADKFTFDEEGFRRADWEDPDSDSEDVEEDLNYLCTEQGPLSSLFVKEKGDEMFNSDWLDNLEPQPNPN